MITDSNQCLWNGSFEVTSPDEITATFDIKDVSSQGMDGKIEVNPTGGISPYSFLWDDGNTDKIRKNMLAGEYTVSVIDANGCEKEFDVEIKMNSATNNIADLSSFDIYPNPANKHFNISISFLNHKDYSLSVLTVNGENNSSKKLYSKIKFE